MLLNNLVRLDGCIPATGNIHDPATLIQRQTGTFAVRPGRIEHALVAGDIRAHGRPRG